ncbi:MAG: hypothetical protein ACR2OW_10955 [Methyloligellaceae bacterium]
MKLHESQNNTTVTENALTYIESAWEEALQDGLDSNILANVTIYAALRDLVAMYGEVRVSQITENLATRIRNGEFTKFGTFH